MRPTLRIRTQLALVALTLLAIPWIGYRYVKTMDELLRDNQVQSVVATARAVAAALQDRPKLLELRDPSVSDQSAAPMPVSEEIKLMVAGLARAGSRIWVVDNRLRLVATSGSLDVKPTAASGNIAFGPVERAVRSVLRFLFESTRG